MLYHLQRKNYSKHLFLCSSLEDLSLKTKFDIAYCSSFYPFVRTNNWEFHLMTLKKIKELLNINGKIVIQQLWSEKNILNNILLHKKI